LSIFALISKLTPYKVYNIFLLHVSYYLSKFLKTPVVWGLPASMSVEPTTACNLGCPECPSGLKQFTRPTGNLKSADFEKIIQQTQKHLFFLTFYFQGEPYINPAFLDMVHYASERKIYTSTSTNGHFLNDENAKKTITSGLNNIIISIDGTTQEIYEKYRIHGSLQKALTGAENLVKWKKELKSSTPHIVFQFIVVKHNEHQIQDAIDLAKQVGVDEIKFKTAQVYDYKNGNSLIPENEKYARYKKLKDGTYQLKNKLENHCWRMWSACVVTWDGQVVPCCFDKDAQHQFGSVKEFDFESIWKNNSYSEFRKKVIQSRKNVAICSNCSEGTKVWL
jgi:radical SAM protein with 4Fe4S-binding SPASM domain